MTDIIRTNAEGVQEVRTGLGWRRVLSPTSSEATNNLPVLDIGDIYDQDVQNRKKVAKTICHAAKTSGFFYIRNHGVPKECIESIFGATKRFLHELTLDEKMEYDTAKHDHYYGYYPIDLNPDLPAGAKLNEAINYGYEPSCDPECEGSANNGDNWWPPESRLPGYQKDVKEYMGQVLKLSRALLRMFALGLDLDEHAFDYLATQPYSILKMAHYPGELTGSATPSSIRPHTDYELLTVLLQDPVPSLEVLSNTGKWLKATPIEGTFIVNIGDSMSMLTNGLFMSTMHRVINNSKKDRYSVPFFLGANQGAELKAIDKFVTADQPAKFQPVNSAEYIRMSLQAVYSKPNIEIVRDTIEIKA